MARLFLLVLLLAAGPALAAETAPVRSPRLTATLVSDTDAVAPGQPFHLGLRLRMAPGWHTYWINPGDAGQPPELNLTLPAGTTAGPIEWPAPLRLAEGPIMTFAYTGDVVLPLTVTPGAGALHIEAAANWLVCEKICVPEEATFTLVLPPGTPSPSPQAGLFAAARSRQPVPSPFKASVTADASLTLAGSGLSPTTVADAWFFPAAWGAIDQAAPQRATIRDGVVTISLKPGEQLAAAKSLAGVIALRDPAGGESFLQVDAPREPAVAAAAAPAQSWLQILWFAVLGGALLNLMPCVFPVLAMKAIGLARMGVTERSAARAQAWSYTAGVVLAFVGLGLGLLGLRAAGDAAGWGFQFQSPVFVASMAALLFLVGLNLSGVFDVGMRFAGAGQRLAGRGGHAGSFFTGLLAVLVATPCTAPFMGAAIAAAFAMPPAGTVAVFAAMGAGMAAPYFLLGLFPGWARILPRPGAWMDVLRGLLAFPMYAACVWLVWVISLQAGPDGVLAVLSALVLLGFGAWAFGAAQRGRGRGRWLGNALAVASLAVAIMVGAIVSGLPISASGVTAAAGAEGAEPFTPTRLAQLRGEGRPVFVNMTAAWCVTCLVNEKIALSTQPVRDAFAKHGVAYLKGDWTRQDPTVTAFLRANARDGVPLYVLYPAGDGAPTILPQILTASDVLNQLDHLGG